MLQDHAAPVDGPEPPATSPTAADRKRAKDTRYRIRAGRNVGPEMRAWLSAYEQRWPLRDTAVLTRTKFRRRRGTPTRQGPPHRNLVALLKVASVTPPRVAKTGRRVVVMEIDVDSTLWAVIDRWCEEQEIRGVPSDPAFVEGARR